LYAAMSAKAIAKTINVKLYLLDEFNEEPMLFLIDSKLFNYIFKFINTQDKSLSPFLLQTIVMC